MKEDLKVHKADPTSVKDYPVDWASLLETGETLVSSTWDIQTGITQDPDNAPSFTPAGITVIWLTGGTIGELYVIENHVVTSAGREYDGSFGVYVQDR